MKLFISIFVAFAACVASNNVETITEIVLFDEIDLSNVQGVLPITGVNGDPAYSFADDTPDLIVNESVSKLFGEKTKTTNVFTVSTYLRTTRTTLKPVMSLSLGSVKPKDTTVAFDVKFGWVAGKDEVTGQVSFLDSSGDVRTFSKKIVVDKTVKREEWIHLAAIIHTDEDLFRFRINDKFFAHGSTTKMQPLPTAGVLRVAQELVKGDENVNKMNRFEGDLQNLTIIFGDDCIPVPVLPTPASTTQSPTTPTSGPQSNTCMDINGKEYENGQAWNETLCTRCVCQSGQTRCVQFCKLCKYNGQFRIDGTSWYDSRCKMCKCQDGVVSCVNTIKQWKNSGCQRKCSDADLSGKCPHVPYKGCFCPNEQVLRDGKCVDSISCPCKVKGGMWETGRSEFFPLKMMICSCSAGKYGCFNLP